MNNQLEKWRKDEKSLATERKLMNEALTLLGQAEKRQNEDRSSGRIIVGLDLTASREDSLHQARIATAAMFDTIKAIGAVAVKLIYYRGNWECKAGQWHTDPAIVSRYMLSLSCVGGNTQIAKMLRVVLAEAEKESISGVVFVGDHCEDWPRELRKLAQTLGERSIPLFVFHECAGDDARALKAKPVFEYMASASGGAYVPFKPDSGTVLKELLSSVAAFSAGGAEGVERMAAPKTPEALELRGRLLLGSGGRGH
jgi:hypothetical protein